MIDDSFVCKYFFIYPSCLAAYIGGISEVNGLPISSERSKPNNFSADLLKYFMYPSSVVTIHASSNASNNWNCLSSSALLGFALTGVVDTFFSGFFASIFFDFRLSRFLSDDLFSVKRTVSSILTLCKIPCRIFEEETNILSLFSFFQ